MAKKCHSTVAREAMQSLQIYKPEFEPMIEMYAKLRNEYDALHKVYAKSGYKYYDMTATGSKKAPIVTTLEALRKDINSYASQLGLTPQGLLKIDEHAFEQKTGNRMLTMLSGLDSG